MNSSQDVPVSVFVACWLAGLQCVALAAITLVGLIYARVEAVGIGGSDGSDPWSGVGVAIGFAVAGAAFVVLVLVAVPLCLLKRRSRAAADALIAVEIAVAVLVLYLGRASVLARPDAGTAVIASWVAFSVGVVIASTRDGARRWTDKNAEKHLGR